jgi:excisionase family DNA binding protein
VYDRSAWDIERQQIFLLLTKPGLSRHFPATRQVFGIFLPNATPTAMRAAIRGKRPAGVTKMERSQSPLSLRLRPAAKVLGISERFLWQLTRDGHIPCVRVGSGKR